MTRLTTVTGYPPKSVTRCAEVDPARPKLFCTRDPHPGVGDHHHEYTGQSWPQPAGAAQRCRDQRVPPAQELTYEQYGGRACYACGKPLTQGAVSRGLAVGRDGAHVLDVEVWACP